MVRVCSGKAQLPKGDRNAVLHAARVWRAEAHEIWDVTDPANPTILLSRIMPG